MFKISYFFPSLRGPINKADISAPLNPRMMTPPERPAVVSDAGRIFYQGIAAGARDPHSSETRLLQGCWAALGREVYPKVGYAAQSRLVLVHETLPWWTTPAQAKARNLKSRDGTVRQVGRPYLVKSTRNGAVHAYSWVLLPPLMK